MFTVPCVCAHGCRMSRQHGSSISNVQVHIIQTSPGMGLPHQSRHQHPCGTLVGPRGPAPSCLLLMLLMLPP